MVIVCPECSTKFRVNPERIPEAGAKVRCARCRHVFLAKKELPEEIAPVVSEPVPPVEAEPSSFTPEPEMPVEPPPEPLAEPAAEEPQLDIKEPESFDEEENSFSYDQFRDLDASKTEEESFTFGSDKESDELSTEPEEMDESFSFAGPAEESTVEEAQEEPAEEPEPPQLSAEDKIAKIFADDEPAPSESEQEPVPAVLPAGPGAKKSNPASSVIRVLLLLILGLAIIAGALYYINGPEQIEQAIQQLFGQQFQQTEEGRISLSELEGKFVNNLDAGELFVIRGAATNNYREPRASIQVKGIIFDQNGKQLLQKTIFCGNPISDQELQTLPFSKLEEMMRNQFGKAMDNMKVNHKETIPFVIAFNDLPKNLSEFSVSIASSEPAK